MMSFDLALSFWATDPMVDEGPVFESRLYQYWVESTMRAGAVWVIPITMYIWSWT